MKDINMRFEALHCSVARLLTCGERWGREGNEGKKREKREETKERDHDDVRKHDESQGAALQCYSRIHQVTWDKEKKMETKI